MPLTPYGGQKMTKTYIALLRAVNAGGVNTLPTKDFVALLERLRLENVKTYIQTGNAVFHARKANAAELPDQIKVGIKRRHGFAPEVVLLTLDELQKAVAANPYPEADSDPKSLHLTFLTRAPKAPDLTTLDAIRKDSERFALNGKVFYFHAPEGVARSKAFSRIEKSLGVAGTARNWRTACRILEIAEQVAT
jgi:uncharacterized protein (DUF1697 family)